MYYVYNKDTHNIVGIYTTETQAIAAQHQFMLTFNHNYVVLQEVK